MKVHIGPYKNWYGPYQLAETLCFWAKDVSHEWGIKDKPEWVHHFGEWLAHGSAEPGQAPRMLFAKRKPTLLYRAMKWLDSKRQRRVVVRIDPWDTWNMDGTLAMIILPMLKQLKATKHGAGFVDDADAPEHLRSTAAPPAQEYHVDANHFLRFDWVLDELIWTFTQLQPDCDWQEQYRSGVMDVYSEPCAFNKDGTPKMYEMKHGPNYTYAVDEEGESKHQARINNGLRLFGKYFQNLWD